MKISRREFLRNAGCGLSMATLASQFEHFGLLTALAQKTRKPLGGEPADYRALVCIFFVGGNDGNNTLVPNHNDANVSNYAAYAAARSPQGLALAQNTLLPISVPRIGGLSYGLHPSFGTVAGGINAGLQPLWMQSRMAAVTNVGTLVRPLSRSEYQTNPDWRPRNLFSHMDQINQQSNASANVEMLSGWGGRISDKVTLTANPAALMPAVTSLGIFDTFAVGETSQPLSIAPAPTSISNIFTLTGYDGTPMSNERLAAFEAHLNIDQSHALVKASNDIHREALRISRTLKDSPEVTVTFPDTELGNQLKQVARLIKSRSAVNITRQIFFCSLDGFDTHTGQLLQQARLLAEFSQAARAFYEEMVIQGISDKVTQFTLTDFGRTLNPGGSGANVGSDHAWGNHQFVIGGSVLGGDFFGVHTTNGTPFPTLVNNGPDDSDIGSNSRGRWIPTTSVEQYAGTLANWFGLSAVDMPYVFPNMGNFPVMNLGFMAV